MDDSVRFQIRKDKLCKESTIKVRYFPGAKFDDFYDYAMPFIDRKPDQRVLGMWTMRFF